MFAALVKQLVDGIPFSVVGNVAVAILVAPLVIAAGNGALGKLWFGALLGVSLFRLLGYRSWKAKVKDIESVPAVCRTAILLSTLTGVLWGVLPTIVGWDPSRAEHAYVPFIITGMPAGAIALQSFVLLGGLLFILPILIPSTITLLLSASGPHHVLVAVSLIFTVFLLRMLIALHTAIAESLHLTLRTERLAGELQRSNESLKSINAELDVALRDSHAASAAKTDFLAKMSHEIRTPMNAIIGMTGLANELSGKPEQRECLAAVQEAAQSLLSIINDVLDLSKVEAGAIEISPHNFDLHRELHRLVRLFTPLAQQKQIVLRYEPDLSLPRWVIGDSLRIGQILMNFLSNAVKFTPVSGVVRLKASGGAVTDDGRSEFIFEVIDSGIGIAPEMHRKIFEAFQQADTSITREFGGSGLGLTISANLAGLMGGAVELNSAVGEVSVFRLRLPLLVGQPVSIERSRQQQTPQVKKEHIDRHLRILIAEDNSVNQRLVRHLLERDGHTVVLVQNGAEAAEQILQDEFDLVLMDCQMPLRDGYEAARAIRKLEDPRQATIPIVALTAHAMQGDRERCLAAGMNSYLTKPIDAELLRATLATLGRQSLPVDRDPVTP